MDYRSHEATEGLGVLGTEGRGFELHSALAVRVETWTLEQRPEGVVLGLFDQQCRRPRRVAPNRKRGEVLSQPRKTQAWAAGFKQAGCPPQGSRWIYVADRESDFYEPIQNCRLHGVDSVVRAYHDRRLVGEPKHLFAAVAQAPVLGTMTVAVRARGNQPARTAVVEVRSVRVDLAGPWRPGGWQEPLLDVGVVEVVEVAVPDGVAEPLHWLLLTSLPTGRWAEVQRVVGYYTGRWWIEEYHKALKSGTSVERSQLESADHLEPLIGILAVVAVRLLAAKMLARSRPEGAEAVASLGPGLVRLLEKKMGLPPEAWTNRSLVRAVARVGGFIGRKSDGEPGWQTIWRGWQRLMWMCEGVNLIED